MATFFALAGCGGGGGDAKQGTAAGNEAVLHTSQGDIVIALHAQSAPATVENFRRYVREGFYAGTVFHRVIPNFVIQGGGFTSDMRQKKTHAPVRNEATSGLPNARGTLSMARTSDPHSATSQFFINLKDNAVLDVSDGNPGYAVFGKVVSGMDVVDAIAAASTGSRDGHRDVPLQPITIQSAELR